MRIAFLGLGQMGSAVAALLLQAGHQLSVWNRSPQAAAQLSQLGARHSLSIGDAVHDCQVAFTMLSDDAATEAVVFGNGRDGTSDSDNALLPALPQGSVHVTLSTISVSLAKRLEQEHAQRAQGYVGAPVFGRPAVAAEGKLWLAVAGAPDSLQKVTPLLGTISRGHTVISSDPWRAHALKLGGNFLISSMIEALSEAFVYAEAQAIDPALFLQTVNEALFRSPFYEAYGKVMLHPPERPGAHVSLGAKDTQLLQQAAAAAGVRLPLADYIARQFAAADKAGLGEADWAVGQYEMAKRAAKINEAHEKNSGGL